VNRRNFITLLAGSAGAWPLAARAQGDRVRRIGVLLPATREDAVFELWVGAFLQGLAVAGWNIGSNVRIDTRHAASNTPDVRRHAAELVALAPDVVLAHGASTVVALLQATRSVPIVFVNVAKALSLNVPDELIARADEVFE
jgi:putative ABC transport system substrate-binding protein